MPEPNELQQMSLAGIKKVRSKYIVGVDEVGLGSWAGPLVVAGVAFPRKWDHPEVDDSKNLSAKKREKLVQVIVEEAVGWSVVWKKAEEIDSLGVVEVLTQCLEEILDVFEGQDIFVVADGSTRNIHQPHIPVIYMDQADAFVPAVSAASIVAKVSRDHWMQKAAEWYPGYAFESNKGYRSEAHVRGLEQQGPCDIHRLSYKPIRKLLLGRSS